MYDDGKKKTVKPEWLLLPDRHYENVVKGVFSKKALKKLEMKKKKKGPIKKNAY